MMFKIYRGKSALRLLFIILLSIVLIIFGKQSSAGALNGIRLCLNNLLPSLFPFMALSVFAVRSGASALLGRVFGGTVKLLFGFSRNTSTAIILSMTGGYPIGAKVTAELYREGVISGREAAAVSAVAVGAGPGFLISFIGIGLFGSAEIGLILFAAQSASIIIIGILNKLIFVRKSDFNSDKEIKRPQISFSQTIIDSVISGTYSALEMCGIVIIFSAVLGIIGDFAADASVYFKTALEVTNACFDLAQSKSLALLSFAVGYGGLCVHFQIFSALKGIDINKGLFFLYRIIQGLVTMLFTYILIRAFGVSVPVFSSVTTAAPQLSSGVMGSAALITCCLCFIYSIKKN